MTENDNEKLSRNDRIFYFTMNVLVFFAMSALLYIIFMSFTITGIHQYIFFLSGVALMGLSLYNSVYIFQNKMTEGELLVTNRCLCVVTMAVVLSLTLGYLT